MSDEDVRDRAVCAGALRRWLDGVWNHQQTEVIDKMFDPEGLVHTERGTFVGPEGIKRNRDLFFAVFTDAHLTVERVVGTDGEAVALWRVDALHHGELNGVPATDERVELRGMTWAEFANGKITTLRVSWNISYILRGALEKAVAELKVLQGILPICAGCKMIRDDEGQWQLLDRYVQEHAPVKFSHGLCPGCTERIYPEFSES